MAYLRDKIVELDISRDNLYAGKAANAFHIFGRRSTLIASTLQDVGDGLTTSQFFPVLTGAETIQAISTNPNDDGAPAGTGAQTIKVTYIDLNYAIVTTGDITLNGVAAVTVVVADMLYYLWAEVTAVGSGGVAAGDITIRTSAPLTMSKISAGTNRSMDACFMVPDGYTGYVPRIKYGNISNSQDFRLRATVNANDRTLSTVFHFCDGFNSPSNTSDGEELPWLKFPARCKITGSTISSSGAANTRASFSFSIILIAD